MNQRPRRPDSPLLRSPDGTAPSARASNLDGTAPSARASNLDGTAPSARASALLLLLLLLCLFPQELRSAPPDTIPSFELGIDHLTICGAPLNDVRVATKLWIEELGTQMGTPVNPTVTLFGTFQAMERALREGRVDMLIIDTVNYLDLSRRHPLEATVYVQPAPGKDLHLLLLARRALPGSLSELKGRRLIVQTGGRGLVPQLWIERLLRTRGLPPAKRHFAKIREAEKASKALLPLFFDEADVSVMDDNSFEILAELNPQLRKEVQILARSETFVTQLLALRKDFRDTEVRKLVMDKIWKLQNYTKAKQLLTFFQVGAFVPYRDGVLDSVRRLIEEREAPGRSPR